MPSKWGCIEHVTQPFFELCNSVTFDACDRTFQRDCVKTHRKSASQNIWYRVSAHCFDPLHVNIHLPKSSPLNRGYSQNPTSVTPGNTGGGIMQASIFYPFFSVRCFALAGCDKSPVNAVAGHVAANAATSTVGPPPVRNGHVNRFHRMGCDRINVGIAGSRRAMTPPLIRDGGYKSALKQVAKEKKCPAV